MVTVISANSNNNSGFNDSLVNWDTGTFFPIVDVASLEYLEALGYGRRNAPQEQLDELTRAPG